MLYNLSSDRIICPSFFRSVCHAVKLLNEFTTFNNSVRNGIRYIFPDRLRIFFCLLRSDSVIPRYFSLKSSKSFVLSSPKYAARSCRVFSSSSSSAHFARWRSTHRQLHTFLANSLISSALFLSHRC